VFDAVPRFAAARKAARRCCLLVFTAPAVMLPGGSLTQSRAFRQEQPRPGPCSTGSPVRSVPRSTGATLAGGSGAACTETLPRATRPATVGTIVVGAMSGRWHAGAAPPRLNDRVTEFGHNVCHAGRTHSDIAPSRSGWYWFPRQKPTEQMRLPQSSMCRDTVIAPCGRRLIVNDC